MKSGKRRWRNCSVEALAFAFVSGFIPLRNIIHKSGDNSDRKNNPHTERPSHSENHERFKFLYHFTYIIVRERFHILKTSSGGFGKIGVSNHGEGGEMC
ncbi:hypothetical protein CA600_11830 [Paenibacillus sp. VTT E-133280]|nr:hypothetical protein CA600_11830 [Paenibacillus sp. VTT E-133280]